MLPTPLSSRDMMPGFSSAAEPAVIAPLRSRLLLTASGRLVRAAEWLLLIVAVTYAGGRVLPRAWQRLNTDFPNYYITARLLHDGLPADRAYEWAWLQRQKDHLGITRGDQPLVGFVPHTPFSALLLEPLTYWSPLAAKRLWICINLVLLAGVAVLLRALTRLEWRRLGLLFALSFPLLRNFEYGQYYLLLLLLIAAALYLYSQDKSFAAGAVMGIAAGLKVFPALFLLYFVRKRDGRAAMGMIVGAGSSVLVSLAAFGLQMHRTYLTQVLPWATRGEAQDPYNLVSNSLSSLLHKLFVFEPEWNPHPVTHAPFALALAQPLLMLVILATAIYLAVPRSHDARRLQLEWSAFLVAILIISTLPASYHFTLLILPAALLASLFLRESDYSSLALLLLLYFAISFPAWPHGRVDRWWALMAVPRLYFLVLLFAFICTTLWRLRPARGRQLDRWAWAAAFAVVLSAQTVTALRHQRGFYDYAGRLRTSPDILLATEPIAGPDGLNFVAMNSDRYSVARVDATGVHLPANSADQLSHASHDGIDWIEESSTTSSILRYATQPGSGLIAIKNGESPVVSHDNRWLAYLRAVKGRRTLWLHSLAGSERADIPVTSPDFDVEEMTFLSDGSLVFAATKNGRRPALYRASQGTPVELADDSEERYPAASPDGRWLAYSRLQGGVWNLWLRDLRTQATQRLTTHDCNDITPSWETDSKTLLYASDCGRALWFTALYRRQVVP